MRWPSFGYAAGARAGRITRVHTLKNITMLGKIWLTSITAVTLLASPAVAAQPVQVDVVAGERIIREVVINGGLIGADSDGPRANELRRVPSWIDHGTALDRRPQHFW